MIPPIIRAMTTYEGWSNYPTWCVNLWLANDEGLYHEALDVVRTAIERPKLCMPTEAQQAVHDVADALKDWLETIGEADGLNPAEAGIASDLVTWAFNQVDWRELAESWIETCDELRKAGAEK